MSLGEAPDFCMARIVELDICCTNIWTHGDVQWHSTRTEARVTRDPHGGEESHIAKLSFYVFILQWHTFLRPVGPFTTDAIDLLTHMHLLNGMESGPEFYA